MFNVVLVNPEIPPNTGNVIRLCANTGCRLHLVAPLGFPIDHARMRRAGLDYHEFTPLRVHADWETFLATARPARRFAFTTHGETAFADCRFAPDDWFVFGAESRGFAEPVLASFPAAHRVRLPMRPDNRSLNLSNAVAVVVFDAWRQHGYAGGT